MLTCGSSGTDRPRRPAHRYRTRVRLRNSEVLRTGDAAEKADIVATNDQNVFPGFQHSGSNPMRPGELPVILRIRLSGDLSSRPAVEPRPRFIVDRAELQFALHTGPPPFGSSNSSRYQNSPPKPARSANCAPKLPGTHPDAAPFDAGPGLRLHESAFPAFIFRIGEADPATVRQLIVQVAAIAVETADLPPEATVYFISSSSRVSFLNSTLPEEPKLAGSNARLVAPSGIS